VLDYADYAILGEGEIAAAKLIHCLETGGEVSDVENICYRGHGGFLVINKNKHYPLPDNPLMPELLRSNLRPRIQWAAVSFSRGCPYSCSFCYSIRILGREFRTKDVASIPLELHGINKEIGARRFYVSDINFATNKRFCHEVANAVRHLDYRFIAMTRIEIADDLHLLRELKAAGFEEYYLGVESESPSVLETGSGLAVDSSGNIWITNKLGSSERGHLKLLEILVAGKIDYNGLADPLERMAHVLVPAITAFVSRLLTGGSISVLRPDGSEASFSPVYGKGIATPWAISIDGTTTTSGSLTSPPRRRESWSYVASIRKIVRLG
jgi:hypothetical protein